MRVVAGLLVTPPTSASLSASTVTATASTITGTIFAIAVSDDRGASPGWSVTLTATNLTALGLVRKTQNGAGSTATASEIALSGAYNGLNYQAGFSGSGAVIAGVFKYLVTAVNGSNMPTEVELTKPDLAVSTVAVGADGQVTANGFTLTFQTAVYASNDRFEVPVDSLPYTQLTITPANLSGTGSPPSSTSGLTLGSAVSPSGSGVTSNSLTTLTAAAGSGNGTYQYDDQLSWNTHANALSATYSATITYTIT